MLIDFTLSNQKVPSKLTFSFFFFFLRKYQFLSSSPSLVKKINASNQAQRIVPLVVLHSAGYWVTECLPNGK